MAELFEHASREDRQRALEKYGAVMHAAFCELIALHRLERTLHREAHARSSSDPYAEERVAKAEKQKKYLQKKVGTAMKAMGPQDVQRLRAFSTQLINRDLSSSDDVIIEDVLRRLTS